ncbi:complexin-3-like [Paramormyrops kingsleyae]|uniref:complexin-3-like n=1 Tax=Paramormyrops kingsleyae TaxID=1676925 RepID=UPI000CD5E8BE|nr:complexin-3-like [Paramormyrops kingsleyae]
MDSVVKRTLAAPFKHLTSCVSRAEEGGDESRARSPPTGSRLGALPAAQMRSYRADLEKERKLRAARDVQRNAERAALRAHYRSKYRLAESQKDMNHLKAVGGKVALPRDLAAMVRPRDPPGHDGHDLLSALRRLKPNVGMQPGCPRTPTPTPGAEQCRVM